MKKLYELVAEDSEVMKHLPDPDKARRLPKEFIWTVIYNLRPEWIEKCVFAAREMRRSVLAQCENRKNVVRFNSAILEEFANLDLPMCCKYTCLCLIVLTLVLCV